MGSQKKRIKESIKLLNANGKELRKYAIEKYVNKDGVAVIPLYLSNDELFDSLSNPDAPSLNERIFEYIEKEAYYIPIEYPIEIKLVSEEKIDNMEYVSSQVKDHYWKKIADRTVDLKHNRWISIILFILGIIILSLYFIFEFVVTNEMFNEIFSIVGSFLIWESADYFLLQRNAMKIDYLNISQLALATVTTEQKEKLEKNKTNS